MNFSTRTYSLLLGLLLSGWMVGAQPATTLSAESFYQRATELHDQQELSQAIAYYTEAINLAPDFDRALFNRGLAYYQQGKLLKARHDFDQVISLDGQDAGAYEIRGAIRQLLDNPEGAVEDYSNAIAVKPSAELYANRATAHGDMELYDEAMADINAALRIDPQSSATYSNQGDLLFAKGDYKAAIDSYDKVLAINKDDGQSLNNRANAYVKLGSYNAAMNDYNQASSLHPDSEIYINRAFSWLNQGEYEKALADGLEASRIDYQNAYAFYCIGLIQLKFEYYHEAILNLEKAVELDPAKEAFHFYKGIAEHKVGEHSASLESFDRAISLGLGHSEAYSWRGLARYMTGDYGSALLDQKKAVQIDPTNKQAYIRMNDCYYSIGHSEYAQAQHQQAAMTGAEAIAEEEEIIKPQEELQEKGIRTDQLMSANMEQIQFLLKVGSYQDAIVELDQLIHNQADNALAYLSRAQAYHELGQSIMAVQDASTALQLQADYAEARYLRGNIYLAAENYNAAINDYSKLLAQRPNTPNAYFMRAQCWWQLGEAQAAMVDYDACIDLNPAHVEALNNRAAIYQAQGDYLSAMEDYNTAILLEPSVDRLYSNRAKLNVKIENFEAALTDYDQAVELAANKKAALYQRAWLRYETQDYAGAVEDYSRLLQKQPTADCYYRRALAHHFMGAYDQALADYTQTIELDDSHRAAYFNRGNIRNVLADSEGACEDYRIAEQLGIAEMVGEEILTSCK
ncbi:MAG: tetratricopeptide repeat protein [Bacteroidota bacterium]